MVPTRFLSNLCVFFCREEKPMARDPRSILPSQWRAEARPRITSRKAYVAELINREPTLSSAPLDNLADATFTVDDVATNNAVNIPRLTTAVARVLRSFAYRP